MNRRSLVSFLLSVVLMLGWIVPVSAAPQAGGWSVSTQTGSYLTGTQKKLFTKATETLDGMDYTPVFLLASQVTSGTSYAFFCKAVTVTAEPSASWKVVIVTKNPKGKVSVSKVNDFNFRKIKTRKSAYASSGAPGSWAYNEKNMSSKGIPSAAKKAFKKAVKQYTGVSLTPLVLLGTQLVAGTNYKFLCRGVMSDAGGTVCLYEVDIYQDLKGVCKVTNCNIINLPKYLK